MADFFLATSIRFAHDSLPRCICCTPSLQTRGFPVRAREVQASNETGYYAEPGPVSGGARSSRREAIPVSYSRESASLYEKKGNAGG